MEKIEMKFYRYELVEYATTDYDGEYMTPTFPNPKLKLREYNLIKETPKGYWINYGTWIGMEKLSTTGRWISKTSRKRFAYPTKKEALENFISRTEKRIDILKRQVTFCQMGLYDAKKLMNNEYEINLLGL